MGTIYLSPDFAAGNNSSAAKRIFEVETSGQSISGGGSFVNGVVTQPLLPQLPGNVSSTLYPSGRIAIMRGTPPTVISTVTSFSSYTSTVLCYFDAADFATISASSYYASPSVLTSSYKPATASGTATWFILASILGSYYGYNTTSTAFQQVVGTVGSIGTGADLEISNVNVTSGQLLRIFNLRFSIPTTFTF